MVQDDVAGRKPLTDPGVFPSAVEEAEGIAVPLILPVVVAIVLVPVPVVSPVNVIGPPLPPKPVAVPLLTIFAPTSIDSV